MTTPLSIEIHHDIQRLSRAVADLVCHTAAEAIRQRGRFNWALSGGSTPRRLYELLAGPPYRDRVEWDSVGFFWTDERCVPPDDKNSNYRMANQALLDRVNVAEGRRHRIRGEDPDPARAADDYQSEIAKACGLPDPSQPPRFDLVLLGLGDDGHTASLFPGSPALCERVRWALPSRSPQPPRARITMTYPVLNRARRTAFLAAGSAKAPIVRAVLEGPFQPTQLPAQGIRPKGDLTWYLDHAAAAGLAKAPHSQIQEGG